MRGFCICFFLFIWVECTNGQSIRIEGAVYDGTNRQAMAYATVQLKSTPVGTTTNNQGRFTLDLPAGEHVLMVSYIGYKSQEVRIKLPDTRRKLEVFLEPLSIELPEIVIGSKDEDPAYRIIRRAIRNKNENMKSLNSMEYDEYRKAIFKSAGQIASIEESFLKGFRTGGEEKDFVLSSFKTENIKKDNKSISGFKNSKLDFYKDTIDIIGNKVHLPLSVNAFDYYDYKLLNTKPTEAKVIYFIQVIPRSEIRPLFRGMVLIEDSSFALAGVDLKNNGGMVIPFITDLSIQFTERKVKFKDVWFPQYLESRVSLGVSLAGLLSVEKMELEQFRSFSNQKINYSGIDTSLNSYKTVMLTKEETDLRRPIPLNDSEIAAYRDLDSTMRPVKLIKTSGVLSNFVDTEESKQAGDGFWGKAADAAGVFFNYFSFKNNRVSGIGLGAYYDGNYDTTLHYGASWLYSLGLKKPEGKGYIGFSFGPKEGSIAKRSGTEFRFTVRAEVFSQVKRWNENSQFPELMNTVSVTLGLEDNFNYFRSQGFSISIQKGKADSMQVRLSFISEKQTSLTQIINHRMFNSRFARRINPAIKEAMDNRLALNLTYGYDPLGFQFMPQSGFTVLADLSLKELGGDFGYVKLYSIGQIRFKTIFRELFFPPFMLIRLEGGVVNGNYGLQHILTPESALAFVSPFGVFKGLKPYDYMGDKMAALHIEHNWRGVIFQSIGLKSLSERNYGITTGLSVLKMWNNSDIIQAGSATIPTRSDIIQRREDIPSYWEIYGGVTGIFGLFRLDGAYTSNEIFVARAGFTLSL